MRSYEVVCLCTGRHDHIKKVIREVETCPVCKKPRVLVEVDQ